VTIKDGDVSVRQVHGRATREWNRRYPLAAGGTAEIVNPNGPIEVMTGPPGSVAVAAELAATGMTDERASQSLDEIQIEEKTAPDRVRIATTRWGGGRRVAYKVTVPEDARVELTANNGALKVAGLRGHVKAMAANGRIELNRLRGTVDAASVNGPVSVRMAEVTGRVRVESTNGQISLEVPKESKATLNLRSVNGGITVTGLDAPEASGRRIRSLESALNGGGPEIDVRVTNGRITIEGK
jgi:hypothetical protein